MGMQNHKTLTLAAMALVVVALAVPRVAAAEEGEPHVLAAMHAINDELAAAGYNLAIQEIHAYTIGVGRPSNRILQNGLRWVPNDPRRLAQGTDLTYLVDLSDGATTSGLTSAQTEVAIDSAMTTWNFEPCMSAVNIVKRADLGADPDIFDFFFGFGGFGNPFLADIVHAGWLPPAFFDAVFGPGGGTGVLAFSVSFIFVSGGVPTDINGDNYLDAALNEVYYNDAFGAPGPRLGFPWGINVPLPGIDVETVALHEVGHSVDLGHFGPPPPALMNPVYAGINTTIDPIAHAGACALYGSWPNP